MSLRVFRANEVVLSKWSGGTSQQYYVYPENTTYAERNFAFRISVATAELDTAMSYSYLPGITRHLVMLEGVSRVTHVGQYEVVMHPYEEIDVFDGSWSSSAIGKVTDLNLMLTKGSNGKMTVIENSGEVWAENMCERPTGLQHTALFCGAERAVIVIGGVITELFKGDLLLWEAPDLKLPMQVQLYGGKMVKIDVGTHLAKD